MGRRKRREAERERLHSQRDLKGPKSFVGGEYRGETGNLIPA